MKPPIYHIDANNSGAWKRVLRDVKAGTLPEVLRAIDWLSAACPGTTAELRGRPLADGPA